MNNIDENKLIFLISQPRSGSSLLQQLLLNSNQIESTPEPWIMLNLIYTYKDSNITSEYNPNYAFINFINFLEKNQNGLKKFKEDIKSLALSLYFNQINDGCFFLDKTPRYYHIIEELHELFPNAKFIYLVRNPLNVFASMLNYNFNGDYIKFLSSGDRIDDLFLAQKKIQNALVKNSNNILIKYEDIIEKPETVLSEIFKYLEIEMPENCVNYNISGEFKNSSSIDTKSLHFHHLPSKKYANSWKKSIATTQQKILAVDYLIKLKKLNNNYFGYDINHILKILKKHKPEKRTFFNLNFDYYSVNENYLSLLQLIKKRVFNKLHKLWLKK